MGEDMRTKESTGQGSAPETGQVLRLEALV